MASMMSNDRNRSKLGIDNPYDSDGFWTHRNFKGNRKAGSPTGKRGWRRAVRAKENARVLREVRSEMVA